MKKYLIYTITAGEGHNSMAKGIKEKLEQDSNNEVKIIDIFKAYGKPNKPSFINDGYVNACKFMLPLFNYVFRTLQQKEPDTRNKRVAQNWIEYETPQMLKDIYAYKPDCIIGTHFYVNIAITNLRKMYTIPCKVISILFDYTVHPFWECGTDVDYLITPTAELHNQLIFKGYKESQLLDYGIPVNEKFSRVTSKQEARIQLKLDPNKFTCLIMLGGGSFGGIDKIVKKLIKIKKDFQIIVVNGHDEISKKKIDQLIEQEKTDIKILNLGFINYVATTMFASDCVIGKCGGLTVNETLNAGRVILANEKLAQQEYDNLLYLTSHNASIKLTKEIKLEHVIPFLIDNPDSLTKMEENINLIKKPNALNDICNLVESFNNATYDSNYINNKNFKIRQELKKIMQQEDSALTKSKRRAKKNSVKISKESKKENTLNKAKLKEAIKKAKSITYADSFLEDNN